MKRIVAFFHLIRFPNLVFIILTQFLFYYCIIHPAYKNATLNGPVLSPVDFWILVFASVLIAAAGYIINDYFDLNIDKINKPGKMVLDKQISRRWAMLFHLLFSLLGLLLTGVVAKNLNNWFLLLFNFISVVLLFFYSTTFKKRLLTGNIIISLLTAWVILVLFAAELKWKSLWIVNENN
jgi:4-hydroxybenzoate polyprenyltransferase